MCADKGHRANLKVVQDEAVPGTENVPIREAYVTLKSRNESGEFQTVTEFHRTDGIGWEARFQPEYDTEYTLTVNVPGKDDITASTRFPEDLRLIQCFKDSYITVDTPEGQASYPEIPDAHGGSQKRTRGRNGRHILHGLS